MRKKLLFLKERAVNFLIITIYFVSTASMCDGTPDDRPDISTIYTETIDRYIDPPELKYDFSPYSELISSDASLRNDLRILNNYYDIDIYGKGSIDNLGTLLKGSDDKRNAEVSFTFTQPYKYTGSIKKEYSRYDDGLHNNVIEDAPCITGLHCVEFYARTVKTNKDIYIKWKREYEVTGVGSYLKIDEEGSIEDPKGMLTKSTGGNKAAVRVMIKGGKKVSVPLANTLPKDIDSGEYEVSYTEETLETSTLSQNVCASGTQKAGTKWNSPKVVKLK